MMHKSDTGKEDKHQKHPIVERKGQECPDCGHQVEGRGKKWCPRCKEGQLFDIVFEHPAGPIVEQECQEDCIHIEKMNMGLFWERPPPCRYCIRNSHVQPEDRDRARDHYQIDPKNVRR